MTLALTLEVFRNKTMLEFLNQNSGFLIVIFTGIVALSTVVYALLTFVLVGETRRMRQTQTEPRVEVIIKPREEWISLIHVYVRNIGLGPAYDISFNISAESGGEGAKALIMDFTRAQFLKTGLRYLGPGQEVVSDYSQMTEKFDLKIDSVLTFLIRYKSANRKVYEDRYRLDFSEFRGRSQIGKPHLYAIAQHLEKIQQDFHRLATGFNRIKADVYNSENREQERKELEKHREQLIAGIKRQGEGS
ncbi:MAG: hypothetical protein FJ130_11210 [Deltaproteobacteria bacterium]|nr:hypothetical protein [Deltaproteobacteria bacterium]